MFKPTLYYFRRAQNTDQGPPEIDQIELVSNEEETAKSDPPPTTAASSNTATVAIADSESDTESIPDLSNESGVRFHLKKKSKFEERLSTRKDVIVHNKTNFV